MLYIIFQIVLFQTLFLLVYDLFLRRETFFNYNRVYLLLTSVVSLVLPFIKLQELRKVTTQETIIRLPEIFIGETLDTTTNQQTLEQINVVATTSQMPTWQIILYIGMGFSALLFMVKITKLYLIKNNNPKRWKGKILIVNLLKSSAAFSFFNTVFLGDNIPSSKKDTIYKHELVHVEERHSIDILFFEILRILFWFSPLVYIYQDRVKELHEFIADAKAVKQYGKSDYYQSLLHQILDTNTLSFTNTFFKKSLIKKRITMLQKSKSKQMHLLKYALLVPMVFGMLIYTSIEVRAQEKIEQENVVEQDLTDEELIKKYYDEITELDKKDSRNFHQILENYDYSNKRYVPTKDEYLRYVAYMRYMGVKFSNHIKASDKYDEKQIEKMKEISEFNRSYEEHLEYLKTEEAIRVRNETNYNRTLQVISNDIDNLTEEEHKDAYEKVVDVLAGHLYRKLIIRDKDETVEITKSNYDAMIRFFSTEEIKTLLKFTDVVEVESIDKNVEVPFSVIDQAPTTKECKDLTDNEERKKCMTQFVNKHVEKNFNTDIANNLKPGKKRVFVQFKVDTLGVIKDIKARGPSEELEVEAKRVLNMLPQFAPGKQRGNLVTVPYSLPISFQVKGDSLLPNKTVDKEDKEKWHKEHPNAKVIPFLYLDEIPVLPECENAYNESPNDCFLKFMRTHLASNLDKSITNKNNINGKKRVLVNFIIDKKGRIKNIETKASHPVLGKEAKRVVKLLPKMKPGKYENKVVETSFSLPIVFR